jgi:hypothetical protein
MQDGMIGYPVPHRVCPAGDHCDPKQPLPFICLTSQKNYMSVYPGYVYGHSSRERWFREAWAKTGKKAAKGEVNQADSSRSASAPLWLEWNFLKIP